MVATRERVAAHRERMKTRGFREVRVWIPDTRTESWRAEGQRIAGILNAADSTDDISQWLDAVNADLWSEKEWV